MKPPRRRFLRVAAGAAALSVLSRIAMAQNYPTRPVRIIVGFAAGGTPDIVARLFGQWLSDRFGQSFVIENRPGAGSIIAAQAVMRAPADGYTLLLVASPNVIIVPLFEKLDFNFIRDIAPVASISDAPFVMVVNPSFPAKTVPEFIAYAKAHPGQINMASTGTGNLTQFAGELFKMMAGVDMVHVPYGGEMQAQAELLSGRAQVMFDPIISSIEYIKAGKLRALAVATVGRLDTLPGIPTLGEFVPGYAVSGRLGVGAPNGTPADVISKLNTEIAAGLADPKLKTRLTELGGMPVSMSPSDYGKFVADETEKWTKVVKFAVVKPE